MKARKGQNVRAGRTLRAQKPVRKGLCAAALILYEAAETVLLFGALLLIAGALYVGVRERRTGEMTFICGLKPIFIESGSMEPTIRTGAFVLLEEAAGEPEVGDIITFRTARGYVTHRCIGVDEAAKTNGAAAYLITKGDANCVEDPERLAPENIIGIVRRENT